MADIDDLRHIIKGQVGIALTNIDLLGSGLEDVVQTAFKISQVTSSWLIFRAGLSRALHS